MKTETKLLRQFAVTDGLLRGTALTSNLFTTAAIALLPAFGTSGVLVSSFLQLSIAGLLEIPTGLLSDRYGWKLSVRFALWLKLIVTLVFLLAMLAALKGQLALAWFLIGLEAIVDALASSFLNGAYQAAFLKWYEEALVKLGKRLNEAPKLFLASIHHAVPLRFGIPVLVAGVAALVGHLSGSYDLRSFAVASILSLALLRAVVIVRVTRQLGRDAIENASETKRGRAPLSGLWKEIDRSRLVFAGFFASTFLYSVSSLYLVGQTINAFGSLGFPGVTGWMAAIVVGLTFYLADTTLASILSSKAVRSDKWTTLPGIAIALTAFGAAGLLLLSENYLHQFVSLFVLTLLTLTLSALLQRYLVSNAITRVSPSYRATWLSTGSALSYALFGLLSGGLLVFNVGKWGPLILASVIALAGMALAILMYLIQRKERTSALRSLKHVLAVSFFGTAVLGAAGYALFDLANFAYSTFKLRQGAEERIANLAIKSIEEPLYQGSFTEAGSRLKALVESGTISCGRITEWNFRLDLCDAAHVPIFGREVSRPFNIERGQSPSGELFLVLERTTLWREILTHFLFSLAFFVGGTSCLFSLLRRTSRKVQREVEQLVAAAHAQGVSSGPCQCQQFEIREFQDLYNQFEQVFRTLKTTARSAAVLEIVTQVRHDIRSPLAALEALSKATRDLSNTERQLLTGAITRISDILETLSPEVPEHASAYLSQNDPSPDPESVLLSELVDEIVREKGLQYRLRSADIAITSTISSEAQVAFTNIDATDFKRVLSNLIDNAVEALSTQGGSVHVEVEATEQNIVVSVVDNGCGIPNDIVPRLGTKGFSFAKEGGTGIGLYAAKKSVSRWQGELSINSEVGRGTSVRIDLPRVASPGWFVEELCFDVKVPIVILDDDPTIHDLWRHRLLPNGARIESFSSTAQLLSWYRREIPPQALYLVDYELRTSGHTDSSGPKTGIEAILAIGTEMQSVLVSSHFGDPTFRDRAIARGIRLLPKRLIQFIPVTSTPTLPARKLSKNQAAALSAPV